MRAALFGLPAIALGMIAVGFAVPYAVAILIVWAVVTTTPPIVCWWRRTDHSADRVATGVVHQELGATLQVLLEALPKAGARWVRVAKTSPMTVRAGTATQAAATGDEIEIVLTPVTPTTTRLDVVSRPVAGAAGAATSKSRRIVEELSQAIDLTGTGGAA